jgi:hypothetical protein
MGSKGKTSDLLDGMIEHVRYEIVKVIHFVQVGNRWCEMLNADLAKFTAESLLEAGLIHLRSVIEFLGNSARADRVVARDYVLRWDWKISDELSRVGELHSRVAHLGTARQSVATDGAFRWDTWLNNAAPIVLRGARDFLMELRTSSPRQFDLFVRPRDQPVVELLALLDLDDPAAPRSQTGHRQAGGTSSTVREAK